MSPDTITVKANSIYPVRVKGKFLTVTACTAALKVELDDEGQSVATAGAQFSRDAGFKKVTFTETSGSDNVISYIVSDSPSPARAIAVVSNQATFAGANSGFYDFGTSGITVKDFPGVDANGNHRKTFILCNSGNTGGGSSNAVLVVAVPRLGISICAIAFPGGPPLIIETDETLRVGSFNATLSGSPAHLLGTVLETFFKTPLQQDA